MKRPVRSFATVAFVVTAMIASSVGADGASGKSTEAGDVKSSYIVRFVGSVEPRVPATALRRTGLRIAKVFNNVFAGAVVEGTVQQIEALRRDPRVASVEPDSIVRISTTQDDATWGLDRIDQRSLPLSSTFSYTSGPATVTAYVVDTGILDTHSEFTGRVSPGHSLVPDGRGTTDCNGHGTHVASTIGGTEFGVAKTVNLVPVRVLDCRGAGSWSRVIAGLDWIAAHHEAGSPAVVNMSLAGFTSSSLDKAVQTLIADGITVVVAAGNNDSSACTTSPARVGAAITVAAADSTDTRASFSNYGSCVDIFAPGVAITAAWSNGGTKTISGTSMASPHVAGAAALILSAFPSSTPAQVTSWLLGTATSGVVRKPGARTPNLLLYVDTNVSEPPEISAPDEPSNVIARAGRRSATVSWSRASDGGSPVVSHVVTAFSSGRRIASVTVDGAATSATVKGLKGGVAHTFTVRAVNAVGSSLESAVSNQIVVLR
jgi:subtilisin family serine protease